MDKRVDKRVITGFLLSIFILAFICFPLFSGVDVFAQKQGTISIIRATALPLVNSEGNQVKVVLNYSMGSDSYLGQKVNAIMGIYDRINGTLIKLSSFPHGFILNNTVGTIQLASTLTDPKTQKISTIVTLTNQEKSEKYSNDVRSDLDLTSVLPTSLPMLNESLPPSSPAAATLPLPFTNNAGTQEETSSDDDSDDDSEEE